LSSSFFESANRFEGKRKSVLTAAHLWDIIDTDPVATIADIAARMASGGHLPSGLPTTNGVNLSCGGAVGR
jgi:hypothetical protein